MAKLHEGVCGNHIGGQTLAHRAHSQGYYWPTMKQDAEGYVKKCDRCQRHAPIPCMPSEILNLVMSHWSFMQWGMNIVGLLSAATAQKKFLLVATNYFSKWVEVEAYANIKDKDVSKFVWKNIICRFGISQVIVVDNEPQFDSIAFRTFLSKLKIKNPYSTPCYPQSNGQVEATNKTLISALKKMLKKTKRRWVDEPPGVLWTYKMTPGRPTWTTPFALVYGMDAVIPTEIGMPTTRTTIQGQRDEKQELERQLDWVDEVIGNTAHPNGILPIESHFPLQQKNSGTHIQSWDPGPQKGL